MKWDSLVYVYGYVYYICIFRLLRLKWGWFGMVVLGRDRVFVVDGFVMYF